MGLASAGSGPKGITGVVSPCYVVSLLYCCCYILGVCRRHTERKKMAALEDPPGAKPSPQRCEALVVGREADETVRSLVDLVLVFLCRVYFHAHPRYTP